MSRTKTENKTDKQTDKLEDKLEVKFTFHDKYGGTWFDSTTNQINIDIGEYYNYNNNITDDEVIDLMSAEIEHEVIHYILNKIEDRETNQRFDLVAYGIYGERFLWLIKNVLHMPIRTKEETLRMYGLC